MPQIRPGRVRTKRDNRRAPLLLSKLQPQDVNVREGEVKSIVCPDCQNWRRLMGDTKLKIREHCVSDKVAEGKKHVRCDGSNQAVELDITVEQWNERMLAADSTATGRRSARQHYKPLPSPAKPVAKMAPAPVSAEKARQSFRSHQERCAACKGEATDRSGEVLPCPDGERLAVTYLRLLRQEPKRRAVRAFFAQERARLDRRYAARAARTRAAEWDRQAGSAVKKQELAKRSGTVVEERNNTSRLHPADTVSEFRGPSLPLKKPAL